MKLSKAFLNEMRTGFMSLINHMARMNGKTSLLQYVDNLYGHIEALEQELDSANTWLKLFSDTSKGELLNERIELKQENLQRLEEVKGLQRQVESLTKFSNQKVKDVKRLNEDASNAWAAYNAEREARVLVEATLERAMLDHQPVALPKVIYDALVYYDKPDSSFTKWGILECIIKESCELAKNARMEMFRLDIDDLVFKALVNGYAVELTLPIAEQLADMIQEWTNEPTFDDEDAVCLKLATAIAERTKEYYSK